MSPMLSSALLELFAAGESLTLEYKVTFDKASIESLVAFANAQGGSVLVGVSDTGLLKGVTIGKETLNEWLGQIKSSTSPSIIQSLSLSWIAAYACRDGADGAGLRFV